MRIVVTGGQGQLGRALMRVLGPRAIPIDKAEGDVADLAIVDAIAHLQPELVIHTAAMTDVDGCARNPDGAYMVNALGTRNVALACQRTGAVMAYISTNEVFDGEKEAPYLEFDEPCPINAYGRSKLAGERFVQGLLSQYYIVRTAWLFGGGVSDFPQKIIARADELGQLQVVTDESAAPTYAPDLARAIARLIESGAYGIYHFTNAGTCSRFDYAKKVLELSGRGGVKVEPITLEEYVRDSRPPRQSALRNFCGAALGITLRPWEEALEEHLRD